MNWMKSLGLRRFFGYVTNASVALLVALLVACSPQQKPAAADDHTGFATRYAAAWSGKDPVEFGAFYEESGSLVVNGSASVGRAAIVETARSYMVAFPDMVVRLDSLREEQGATVFHWTWTGTFGPNGLILSSDGHFDDAEYQRQLTGELGGAR